jgi:hypothetical protein
MMHTVDSQIQVFTESLRLPKLKILLLICTAAVLCTAITVSAQEAPEAGGSAGRTGGVIFGDGGGGGNTMVSMTPPANVNRIKLYEKTPNIATSFSTMDMFAPGTFGHLPSDSLKPVLAYDGFEA